MFSSSRSTSRHENDDLISTVSELKEEVKRKDSDCATLMLEKNDMITTVQDLRQKLSEENDHGITHVKKMKEEIKSKLG
jgi:uncharacterized protein YoxC